MKFLSLFVLITVSFLTANLNRHGLPGVNKTNSAQTLGHGNMGIGLFGTVSTDSRVVEVDPDPNRTLTSISGYPFLSLGISNFFDISAILPIYWDDIDYEEDMQQMHMGDFRYNIKIQIPYIADKHIADAAFLVGGVLPTAHKGHGIIPREIDYITADNGEAPIFGHRVAGFSYGLAVTLDIGAIVEPFQFKWHVNVGGRKTFKDGVEGVLFYSTAFDYRILQFLSAFVEFQHESRGNRLGESGEFRTEPTTLNFGTTLHTPADIEIQLGLSVGLNSEYIENDWNGSQVGTYRFRSSSPLMVMAGICWNGWLVPQDDDKDGLVNSKDGCPKSPEDKDGYKDNDGCPDNDNDEDGIADNKDTCPDRAEDLDGFQDDDGCPDADNDLDGIADIKDACPQGPEDIDGFEDADGCPDIDNDKDGVPDSTDKCLMVAEDLDNFEDSDGCPDIDNDKDGIVDEKDKCPSEAETVNGFNDEDGCPDKVKEIEKKVTLQGVNFKTGSSELTFESFKVLNGVAEQLLAYPDVKIEIRGHTDNVGSAGNNQRLSERRARSVIKYLSKKGVAHSRMKAIGFGETQPIAPNRTASGRRENRRIEMYRIK